MPEYYIHPFWLVGIIQVTLFLAVATVYLWFRSTPTVQQETIEKKEPREGFSTYIAYLDNELDIADNLPEQEEVDEDQDIMLGLRRGFLDIERVTNALGSDTEEFQKQYAKSLKGLINQYLQDTGEDAEQEPSVEEIEPSEDIDLSDDTEIAEGDSVSDTVDANPSDEDESRNIIDTQENEFKSLKEIIKNQHDAMKSLREQLEKKGDDEGMSEIDNILKQVEQEHLEIGGNIDKFESSNEEGGHAADDGDLLLDDVNESAVDMEEISGIVSGQQNNITQLRKLIANLGKEHEEAFESSVINIERTNNDLSSCLTFLIDDNDDLRTKLTDAKEGTGDVAVNEVSA